MNNETPKGRFDDKIILADKPLDYTSADIVRIFKGHLNVKKIGHSGTLDPKASGLLVLCTGKKTKMINEFIDYDKEYEGIIRIGAVTKSYDTESEEEYLKATDHITDDEISKAGEEFAGEIEQVPPMFSALKHKGKPLYKFARKGKEIVRAPRKIFIKEFQVERMNTEEVFFRISCSKGTYIRSIANDFGEKLKVGGYLKSLRRIRVGKFKIEGFRDTVKNIPYKVLEDVNY